MHNLITVGIIVKTALTVIVYVPKPVYTSCRNSNNGPTINVALNLKKLLQKCFNFDDCNFVSEPWANIYASFPVIIFDKKYFLFVDYSKSLAIINFLFFTWSLIKINETNFAQIRWISKSSFKMVYTKSYEIPIVFVIFWVRKQRPNSAKFSVFLTDLSFFEVGQPLCYLFLSDMIFETFKLIIYSCFL